MVGRPLLPAEAVAGAVPAPEVVRPEAATEVVVDEPGAAGEVVEPAEPAGLVVVGAELVVPADPASLVVVDEAATAGWVEGLELLWTARPTTPATSRAAIPPPTTSTGVAAPGALPKSRTTHLCLVDPKALSGRW